jgi:hypothetical protein
MHPVTDLEPLVLVLEHRRHQWEQHCHFVLERLLLPLCQEAVVQTRVPCQQAVVLIENRINLQWLFTLLNSWLMCPLGTEFCLITDRATCTVAAEQLSSINASLQIQILCVEDLSPETRLSDHSSFNRMLKEASFWQQLPQEQLLVIQTDALLARPLDPFFFRFPYLGAPFLPRQHSEYFAHRRADGRIRSFFKTDTPIHGSPNPDVYPHLHGNGGLSIRHRSVMTTLCQQWGGQSPDEEAEDVFFSRHLSRVAEAPPLEIAQAFATETTYNPMAVGSHACWKFLDSSDLADHLDQHLRAAWAMAEARRQPAN